MFVSVSVYLNVFVCVCTSVFLSGSALCVWVCLSVFLGMLGMCVAVEDHWEGLLREVFPDREQSYPILSASLYLRVCLLYALCTQLHISMDTLRFDGSLSSSWRGPPTFFSAFIPRIPSLLM